MTVPAQSPTTYKRGDASNKRRAEQADDLSEYAFRPDTLTEPDISVKNPESEKNVS